MDNKEYADKVSAELKDIIKNDVSSGNAKGEAHYLAIGLNHLKVLYKRKQQRNRFQVWDWESTEEIAHIWDCIMPEMTAFIQATLKFYRHRKLTRDIRSASAKAVIDAAMKEAGLRHRYTGQVYRAKISVLVSKDRCITLSVAYSKLNEELPHIVQSLLLIKRELDALGDRVSINKAQGVWPR